MHRQIQRPFDTFNARRAASDFDEYLTRADDRRAELAKDQRSKDYLLSFLYERADRAMRNLRRMGYFKSWN